MPRETVPPDVEPQELERVNAACLTCGRPFDTVEVKVMHFTFPASRYCEVCRQAEEVEQAESHAAARFMRTGVPLAYRDCSFATFKRVPGTGDALAQAMNLSKEVRQGRRPSRGLLFHGPPGAGKTHLAIAILHEAAYMQETASLFINVPTWLQRLRDLRSQQLDGDEVHWSFPRGFKIVVLDDLGNEKPDDWSRGRLYSLVNERESSRSLTIVTTNLTLGELDDRLGKPIASRIRRLCHEVRLTPNQDFRALGAASLGAA